jgi:hypothetical protein
VSYYVSLNINIFKEHKKNEKEENIHEKSEKNYTT